MSALTYLSGACNRFPCVPRRKQACPVPPASVARALPEMVPCHTGLYAARRWPGIPAVLPSAAPELRDQLSSSLTACTAPSPAKSPASGAAPPRLHPGRAIDSPDLSTLRPTFALPLRSREQNNPRPRNAQQDDQCDKLKWMNVCGLLQPHQPPCGSHPYDHTERKRRGEYPGSRPARL